MGTDLGASQREHWQDVYDRHPHMYGADPSEPARHALEVFTARGAQEVLELGSGHGRDALWLATQGLEVHAADFSAPALQQLTRTAREQDLSRRVHTHLHDVRTPLPLADASVDGVFAHMLLCMALSTEQIHALMGEIGRVLRPGGALVYTVRHTEDAHYGTGASHGDDIFEHGGFAVHFFDRVLVDGLARGWDLVGVEPFEEGELPRRLWRVTQVKPALR
ncbi:class I SAM-dependent methyltransferase [Nocardiopsis tropica]|uniref:Class I SAM-dependent methyltransferase n=1 Tax=Nocardiopsis tropica TaxID=109330 RepID=A0ABU7KLU4_9ACTN|nr:class I SAM-dependent methyltransferase [Nocardiopsis umidischolae]MEE2049662.1 class I SAM-dependent methyltransferase [Nocardiopsis umidischolae]